MASYQEAFEAATAQRGANLAEQLRSHATALASECSTTPEAAAQALLSYLRTFEIGLAVDGRSVPWRARLRLYSEADGFSEPVADSDPNTPPDEPGALVLHSLPDVCGWIAELACLHHGVACAGLSRDALKRKLPGVRTQLTNRKNGTATLRVSYSVLVRGKFDGLLQPANMLARCDIVRESSTHS